MLIPYKNFLISRHCLHWISTFFFAIKSISFI